MSFRVFLLSLGLFGFSFSINGQAIDSENSVVSFSVTNMGFNTVTGTFKGMNGNINFNQDNVANSSFDVCIDASTIDTGNSKRDKHLKNKDFFEVDKYPNICFTTTEITKTQSGYKAVGMLSMHGISQTIEIPFTFSADKFVGDFKLDRFDYKIGEGTNKFMVGKEIEIKIVSALRRS